MHRTRLLSFCILALALAVSTFSQTPLTSAIMDPPPSALFLTPDHFAMILGETRKLALVDDLGRAIPPSSWSASDSDVAQLASDGTVTAVAVGVTTITSTYESLTATAELTVYASSTLVAGTVRWSVRPLPGSILMKVLPGQPIEPEDPDVYFVEKSGSQLVIRALTADGRQKWTHTILPTLGTASVQTPSPDSVSVRKTSAVANGSATIPPHRWGKQITELMNQVNGQSNSSVASSAHGARVQPATIGTSDRVSKLAFEAGHGKNALKRASWDSRVVQALLAFVVTDAGNYLLNRFEVTRSGEGIYSRDDIIVLDGNRKELWRHSIVGGEMGFALHAEGIVYIVQADYQNNGAVTLFAMDELTGATKFSIPLPSSYGGQAKPLPGLPSTLPDGNLYLPFETLDNEAASDVLRLLKVSPDGTQSWTVVAKATPCHGPVISPNEALPDGQGGILVTWQYIGGPFCAGSMSPVQVTHLTVSGESRLNSLPLPELQSYFSDNDGDAILGAQHLFITDGRQGAAGLNLNNSSIDLNWRAPDGQCTTYPCPQISIMGAARGDRLLVSQTGKRDGSSTVFASTPNSDSCPNLVCVASSSVSNATLAAFDFNGAALSEVLGQSALKNQYFFSFPALSANPSSLGTQDGGGIVTVP
jgi:hypothetical protein